MKMKIWTFAIALVAIAGLCLTTQANGAQPTTKGNKGNRANLIHGKVTNIDLNAKTITVTTGGKNDAKTYTVDVSAVADAQIKLDNKPATLAQLSEAVNQ